MPLHLLWGVVLLASRCSAAEDVHGAASILQCEVCQPLVEFLSTKVGSWRPLRVTDASVRSFVAETCALMREDSFVKSLLETKIVGKTDSGEITFDERADLSIPDAFEKEAVSTTCHSILDSHSEEFIAEIHQAAKKKANVISLHERLCTYCLNLSFLVRRLCVADRYY